MVRPDLSASCSAWQRSAEQLPAVCCPGQIFAMEPFRPIKPHSPHLNGEVDRSQRTDLEEFWATADLASPDLAEKLMDWQCYYNEFWPRGSLGAKTPWERWGDLLWQTPYHDEVEALYDPAKERIRRQNYKIDLRLAAIFEARQENQTRSQVKR